MKHRAPIEKRRSLKYELAAIGFLLFAGGMAAWATASIGIGAIAAVGTGLILWGIEKASGKR